MSGSLSPMQRGLVASQGRYPTAPLQNMALLSHLDGPIDPDRLADAFAWVVAASDVLHSRIDLSEGAAPRMADPVEAETAVVDVSTADAGSWAARRARVPIDIGHSLFDSVLLRHDDGTWSWYLGLHHAATDAMSSALVFDLTAAVYEGETVEVPSYYEWVERQQAADDRRVARAAAHWRDRSPAPLPPQLYRPVRRVAPDSTRIPVDVPEELLAGVAERIRTDFAMLTEDLGWTALLLTVAAVHVHRVSGSDRFAIGIPVHGRSDAASRQLIGPVMEVFPVDVEIREDDTYRSLHARLGKSVLTTIRHARPGHAPSQPDFSVIVNVTPRAGLGAFGSVPSTTSWIHPGASDPTNLLQFQFTGYGETGSELVIDVNDEAAGPAHRERLAGHVTRIMSDFVADPDRQLAGGSIVGGHERAALDQWAVGGLHEPAALVVDALDGALAMNDDVVIEDPATRLTGAQLWRRSGALASWLRAQGVGSGDRVGIEMDRGVDAVVAILATLRAGASYVPIDPAQPKVRRSRLAERSACALVMRELPAALDEAATAESLASPAPSDEAYLLFTSGSTGEPKGVPITHRGLADYVHFAQASYVDPDVAPVAPLFSALTFDLTVTSLFVPLLAGGRLVVIPEDGPAGLRAIARRDDLTWMKATPSHLEVLRRLECHAGLRSLVVGGEAFGMGLADQLAELFPQARIFNEYGPTEAVVGCMLYEHRRGRHADEPDVPIGVPAPGVELRILDESGQAVPIGAPGELCIAHRGMTAGYLDDAGDADDSFVELDGTRFYRSGDLVRLIDEATLTYLGRIDEQVKVGGIRLEPTEVEQALAEHPAIGRAAVRLWSPSAEPPLEHCVRCGLPANVPGVHFDDDGVCATCHSFDAIKDQADAWFNEPDDLVALGERSRTVRTGAHDCLHLLSGGMDSTYALYQLVEMGFDVYALTLDNGFLSEGAEESVHRSVADLGIDHEFVTTEAMNEIFRDSLERYSDVCNGCNKTLSTRATNRAVELGIPMIVTGLSRGQLFETRLAPQQFTSDRFDPDTIDRAVRQARIVYHRADDAPNRLLDTEIFATEDVFDRVSFVDFYRYVDVERADMVDFLESRAPWVRTTDTGLTTNCLINAAGIATHLQEQGYHNYAIPHAWDVRLGHRTRDEAIEELDVELDEQEVGEMLTTVGYRPRRREVLTAWYEVIDGAVAPSPAELRSFLTDRLPGHAIPAAFAAIEALPVTSNGKLDADALPAPARAHRGSATLAVSPETEQERTIVEIYERVLGTEPIGVTDDFFDLGGDSLGALEVAVALSLELGVLVREELAFTHTSARELAAAIAVDEPGPDDDAGPTRRPDGDPPELSTGEQSMLFEHLADPTSARYNVGRRYSVKGAIDIDRFEVALRSSVAHHAPLHWSYGSPRRPLRVDAALEVRRLEPAPTEAGVSVEEFDAAVLAWHVEPFDLEDGPLTRCLLASLDDGTVGIGLLHHHVSTDASTLDVQWAELDRRYRGVDVPLLEVDYADYMAWRAERRPDELGETWTERARPTASLELGTGSEPGPDGHVERVASFSARELRAARATTPFATALTGLVSMLRQHADGDSIGVGVTASTRFGRLAEPLVGYFLNTLPVVVDVAPGDRVEHLTDRAGQEITTALAARDYPIAKIVADRRRRGLPAPALDVILAFDELADHRFGSLDVEHLVLPTESAVTHATFFVQLRGGDVMLAVEYRGSVLDQAAAEALLDELDAAIGRVIHEPTGTIELAAMADPLARLDHRQRDVLVGSWSRGAEPRGSGQPTLLHRLIERSTSRTPDATALVAGEGRTSYAELGRQADQLAARLLRRGVTPGSFVGVAVRRHPDAVVAICGVLKAGAAYVPIDLDYPIDVIRHVLDDASLDLVVAAGDHPTLAEHGCRIISPTDAADPSELSVADTESLAAVEVGPDDPAYVIYTSGSTGRPKGVVVRHRNIVHSTLARSDVYEQDPARFLLLSSFSFDSSMVGLFWPLATGGSVVLPGDGGHQDVLGLGALIEREAVTHLLALPSLYRLVLEENTTESLATLTTAIVAGEACDPSVVRLHAARCPEAALYNEYGPTEATVWSHVHRFASGWDGTVAPIGRPIPATTSHVFDRQGRLVPIGVPGELVIGGPGVAAGYLGRPDLTAERFVELPEQLGVDGDAYRTGDLVEWTTDGELLFRGRVDGQVKIHGHRVELGEVEAATLAFPGVTAATAGLTLGGRPQLAVWLSHRGGEALSVEALRSHLGSRLPEHMVPRHLIEVTALPLMPNGKVDRDALPEPGRDSPSAGSATSDVERVLCGVLAELLDVPDVGVDDDFFQLGGDSILSIQMVARLRAHGLVLTAREVFDHPTIAELATRARPASSVVSEQGMVAGDVPLTPTQRWFFEHGFAHPNHWNQSLWIDVHDDTDVDRLVAAAQVLPTQHDMLRARFERVDGDWRQWLPSEALAVSIRVVRPEGRGPMSEDRLDAIAAEVAASLDLSAGELMAGALFVDDEGRPDRLFVTVHHLVVDGVSWKPLLEDWAAAYQQLAAGRTPLLPAKSTSFRQWAELLEAYAASERVAEVEAEWSGRPPAAVPAASVDNTEGQARLVVRSLPTVTSERLLTGEGEIAALPRATRAPALQFRVGVETALLAAFGLAQREVIGEDELAVMLEGHGREDVVDAETDLSRTVGWFTVLHPVVVDLREAGTIEALGRVAEVLAAVPDHGLAYHAARFRRRGSALRGWTEPPITVNYLGRLDRSLDAPRPFGSTRSMRGGIDPRNRRPQLLGVVAAVYDGEIEIEIEYLPELLAPERAEQLANRVVAELREIAEYASPVSESTSAATDFELAGLSDEGLAELGDVLSQLDG